MTGDDRCHYQVYGRRCPLTGARTSSNTGKGVWYCQDHWQHLGNTYICEMILNIAEKNLEKLDEKLIDWRRRIFPDEHRILKVSTKKRRYYG